jgi:hypothetical protein
MARERTGASSFDELAVGLSSGDLSRREALKWLGAALLGGALAFTPKVAEASSKASFCFDTQFRQHPVCATRHKDCEELLRSYNNTSDPAVSDRCYRFKG